MSSHKLKSKAAFFPLKYFQNEFWMSLSHIAIKVAYISIHHIRIDQVKIGSTWIEWEKCHFQNSSNNWMVKYKCHSCTLLELFHCFVTNYSSMKVYWGLKSLHCPPVTFLSAYSCIDVFQRLEHIQHVLQDEKTVKERILLFNHLNTFLFLPHSFHSLFKIFWLIMADILAHDLFTNMLLAANHR